jgi:hypothetical protein
MATLNKHIAEKINEYKYVAVDRYNHYVFSNYLWYIAARIDDYCIGDFDLYIDGKMVYNPKDYLRAVGRN